MAGSSHNATLAQPRCWGWSTTRPADFNGNTAIEDVANVPGIGAPPPRIVANPDGSQDTIFFGNAFPAPQRDCL